MVSNEDIDATKAPLLDHLIELRGRLIKAIIAILIAFLVCYWQSANIFDFLIQPLLKVLPPGRGLIYTAPQEAFFTYVKLSLWGAIMIAFPIIASQIWMFVAPGLYRHERKAFLPFLIATPVLFILGAALAYYGVIPLALKFFAHFETAEIRQENRVSEYLSFFMTLIFGFGLAFQMPVLLTLMGKVGLISSDTLKSKRRYAIVGVFIVAAVATPPDPVSQISLALPMIALYEISIFSVRMVEKKREEEREKED